MKDETLVRVMQQYGTPCFVFDTGAFERRIAEIREIWGEKIAISYSVKANPFLIPAAVRAADRLEVCSPGELEICENLSVPMDRIVYSGVNKEHEDVRQALSDRVGVCTAESLRHVRILEEEGERAGIRVPVLLRLNSGAQFGMSREDLLYVADHRDAYPHVEIRGLHYFVGTQRKNRELHQQKEELGMLRDFFREVKREHGLVLQRLEYGPGLPVPLFEGDDFSDTLAPARELAEALQEATEWADLTVEAGRFFATECGTYLTKVVDVKSVGQKNYCITDGGINHVNYLGQLMGMKQPVIRHFQGNGDPDADPSRVSYRRIADDARCTYALCGSLCTTNDDLVRERKMSPVLPGDVLAFENIGAYSVTEGIYLFLSRQMPRIILCDGDGELFPARDFVKTSGVNTIRPF